MESYVERPPLPGLAGVVRTVWIQRTGEAAYVQRHLPTGGVEIHFPIGDQPRLLGPLTGPEIEVIPARTTSGRHLPGRAPSGLLQVSCEPCPSTSRCSRSISAVLQGLVGESVSRSTAWPAGFCPFPVFS
jgi:hypothetical protein